MNEDEVWKNYFQVAAVALQTGSLQIARTMFQAAAEYCQGKRDSGAKLAASNHGLALVLLSEGETAEAQALMRKAIRLYAAANNIDSRLVAEAASRLADSYIDEKLVCKALPVLKAAARNIARKDGCMALPLVPLFKRIAAIYCESGYSDKGELFFRRALNVEYGREQVKTC